MIKKDKAVSTGTALEISMDRRFWPHPEEDKHILGEIRCVVVGKARVRALMLYDASVGRGVEPSAETQLRGKVIGSMDAIRCTICGKVHDWIIGQDAMDELISRVTSA
jgi:hypothetical protein